LCFAATKSQQSARAMNLLKRFASRVPVLALDEDVGIRYGEIRAQFERAGTPIRNNDLWVAAHARALGMRLITNNARVFERVPGLVVERWV
jgi:tRNA(fMet)-specific endonuclease VapC